MKRLKRIIAVACLLAGIAAFPMAAAKGWEPVRGDVSSMKQVAHENEVEVRVASGQIVVISSHQVQIKIFTILGQMVCSDTLSSGTSRLTLSHGVYIVKVGDLTCKIAV